LKEQQVHKKLVGEASEKKYNPQTCSHPHCHITRKGRIAGIGKFSTVPFYENKDGAELVRLLKNAFRKPKVFEMALAIVLLEKFFCNNIRKDKNNGARLILHVAIDRSGRNLKPLKN